MSYVSNKLRLHDSHEKPCPGHDLLKQTFVTARRASALLLLAVAFSSNVPAQESKVVLERNGKSIVIEPYALNIIRITLGNSAAMASGAPGYGLIGTPSMEGWTKEHEADGSDMLRSSRLVVHLSADHLAESLLPHPMPLDTLNLAQRKIYFGGGGGNGPNDGGHNGPNDDTLGITTTSGTTLLTMRNWAMFPNKPDAAAKGAAKQKESDPGYRVSATFDSPADEHLLRAWPAAAGLDGFA